MNWYFQIEFFSELLSYDLMTLLSHYFLLLQTVNSLFGLKTLLVEHKKGYGLKSHSVDKSVMKSNKRCN